MLQLRLRSSSNRQLRPSTEMIFYFIANSQNDNLKGDKGMDVTKLAAARIAVVRLP